MLQKALAFRTYCSEFKEWIMFVELTIQKEEEKTWNSMTTRMTAGDLKVTHR
jgi:hypothetical protein